MSTPFASRHIGPSGGEEAKMLAECGYGSLDALIDAAVPASIRSTGDLALPQAATETSATEELRAYAARNRVMTQMIGLGYYDTITPSVIRRGVLENPAWYTAYTPYQPEISQGRLEALLNFQTMVADLTGLATSNASLLDEPTAVAEAMLLMRRTSKSKSQTLVVDAECLPQNINVLRTRAAAVGIELDVRDLADGLPEEGYFGVIVQYPGASGRLRDADFYSEIAAAAKAAGALYTVAADLLALTLVRAPGEFGADIAVGTTQRFGVPLGYGGPHAGYMCVRSGLERGLPGRLVGVSVDEDGAQAYRLALQTREQHIRREKATSNICTAQVLPAVLAAMYAVYHGPDGLAAIARRVHAAAAELADALRAGGVEIVHEAFFDTVLARVPGRAAQVHAAAREREVNLGLVDADHVRIACDEKTTGEDLAAVLGAFDVPAAEFGLDEAAVRPDGLKRTEGYLGHEVFRTHHSETAMMRYLRELSDMDYALDRGMIPLGSCTMKLNAATEMEPISWPEFATLHPYAPAEDAAGYRAMSDELCRWLAEVTGYDSVSVQPNAGSQGEFAGLLAIREYHKANGSPDRDVCLIPSSAHGTNAASAILAGMRVVVVACTDNGDVDLDALRTKVDQHADTLAAIMVTYPSTHGVYEEGIEEIAKIVHDGGGQVYVDGANLNALLGLAKPGEFGGDVSHLNLHKTFCIPHGGGGPGVGPVAARAHLAPYLPADPIDPADAKVGPVAGATLGSASILPISWAYMRMMGPDGLTEATKAAVLTANYVAARLAPHYPVLYTGRSGLVAHECILDLRGLTKRTGVTVDDVAKRLIDYGFHAPTMSFPVNGTFMVEPTESEDVAEIDRFCAAMIDIGKEIEDIERGRWPVEQSPLRHAPHTAATLTGDWTVPYDRKLAVYPPGVEPKGKYWPPVRRIDNASGDRNLVCSCPPMSAYDS